jgi:peptidoglycan glycosyltransferase
VNRSIRRLYLVLAGGFGLLLLMLGWWQVVAAEDLRDRPGNTQTLQAERLIDRGRIISADGRILAASRAVRVSGQRVYERLYPQGSLAAHAVGYSSADLGRTGIEGTYNRYLSGSFGTEPLLQRLNLKEKRGADVELSLDTRIQRVAEEALAGRRGAVVALDPRTGEILALASSPSFDLQQAVTDFDAIPTDGSPFLDRATAGLYPPGSTFKVVTATAALQSGEFTPSSSFDDTGSYDTPGGPIRNFGGEIYGRHDFATALTNSINTTFARIGDEVGADRMDEQMTAFGFGDRPPVDLPSDEVLVSGRRDGNRVLPNAEQGMDLARLAIGQERLTVTPLQMAMVAAAVANGGTLMAPHLMTRILDRGGDVVQTAGPKEVADAMDATTAAELASMMQSVVEQGTGTPANLSAAGVDVAGKTGTAESDDPNSNDAWFLGFAPAQAPTVAVAVVIEDTPGTGGAEAAPIAAQVISEAIDVR